MNLYTGLPNDLATQIRRLMEPHVLTERQRTGLISEAFFFADPRISPSIEYDGTATEFARSCTNHLLHNVKCLEGSQEHSVSRLLQVVRDQCGIADQARIDEIVAMLDPRCNEQRAIAEAEPTKPSTPVTVPDEPLQTEKTPPNRRTPTVFVSYSHRDTEFAQRLIADLQQAGHAVWIDVNELKGGDEWVKAISEGIINSYAFIVVVTPHALESKWVQDEILWAKQRERLIIPVILDASAMNATGFFALNRYQGIRFDAGYGGALADLLSALPSPTISSGDPQSQPFPGERPRKIKRDRTQRESELEYLDRLRLEVLLNTEKYTALAGQSQITRDTNVGRIAAVVMRPEFALLGRDRELSKEIRRFDNAVAEILALRQVVVLGEPGAGKTTTLWRLASDLAQKAIDDPAAPIPLVMRLGRWTDEFQLFEQFVRHELGNLGAHLDNLLQTGRAALLFDGLNEIPVSQRKRDRSDKDHQVEQFIRQHRDLLAVVSCRAQDYNTDLGFDRIEIQPLDPLRIREFLTRYLNPAAGRGAGERLFWQIVGDLRLIDVWKKWQAAGASFELFFEAKDVPRKSPNVVAITSVNDDQLWRDHVRQPSSLITLSRNPYMLTMLAQVFQSTGALPENRGQLFQNFVSTLFARENIIQIDKHTKFEVWPDDAIDLLRNLSELAFEMQQRRAEMRDDESEALTVLPLYDAKRFLSQRELYLANSANVLSVGESVRFTHQLLQEYFAAVALRGRVFDQYRPEITYLLAKDDLGLKAASLWKPDRWWERTNWEESAILFAGLYADDCTPVIEWLMDANPEVAADCIVRSGAKTPDSTLLRLRERWTPRLTDLRRDPSPLARAAIGRALGKLRLNTGEPLDNRNGVSVVRRGDVVLPDIDWCDVPAGEFIYQKDQKLTLPAFQIARYPVTFAQFQCFVDAPDFGDDRWWTGISVQVFGYHTREVDEQTFKFSNHPRETVSWYHAVAFCRWLSDKLGYRVELPTEQQWERAARGTEGLMYPYGNTFAAAKGNTDETGIDQTSAVGIFPDGHSPDKVEDMSGNVLEWCLSKHRSPHSIRPFIPQFLWDTWTWYRNKYPLHDLTSVDASGAQRVLRGGSWINDQSLARAVSRDLSDPLNRFDSFGFRICRPPS
jgi:formylglycine-generating enzyme required for sulfatase activity